MKQFLNSRVGMMLLFTVIYLLLSIFLTTTQLMSMGFGTILGTIAYTEKQNENRE